ncbi:MAG: 3-hydroxyacyl-CoA dehydrogenase family protein [Ferruginibacter sp.]
MKIAVLANDEQWNELNDGTNMNECVRIYSQKEYAAEADGFLVLDDSAFDFFLTEKPVIKNAVDATLKGMKAPINVVRINGWSGFLKRSKWEVAGAINNAVQQIFSSLGKQPAIVVDEVGFVTARIISMIINEAYFALGENISTKEEIDIAMKLGTNYPYGPFEWAAMIGTEKVYSLLLKLSAQEGRYIPAPLLKEEATL